MARNIKLSRAELAKLKARGIVSELEGKPVAKKFKYKSRTQQTVPGHWCLTLTLPCRIRSEMNLRDHWATRYRRFQAQKKALCAVWWQSPISAFPIQKLRVTFVHLGKRMDDDNLSSGFKAQRDQIAGLLGINDGSDRVEWRYEQRESKVPGVEVRIEPRIAPSIETTKAT